MHYDNTGVVLCNSSGSLDTAWMAPFTTVAWEASRDWTVCRSYLSPGHDRPWLNLHSAQTMRDPMAVHTFNRLLVTYVGQEWSFRRLRVTCAAAWVRSELPLEHVRQLLGLARIEDVLPYARLVRGSLEGEMEKRDTLFREIVQPLTVAA